MSKSVVVLAVPHQLQGKRFGGYIDVPSYSRLVKGLIRNRVDFVFEEAGGLRPSIAEDLAQAELGPGHYMDVDPPPSERPKLGIEAVTGGFSPNDPFETPEPGVPADGCDWSIVEEQVKREKVWRERIEAQPFTKGLMVCGLAHSLSFAFGLLSAGMSVENYNYAPFSKLCTRTHAS
jgi:hypothetical protein